MYFFIRPYALILYLWSEWWNEFILKKLLDILHNAEKSIVLEIEVIGHYANPQNTNNSQKKN